MAETSTIRSESSEVAVQPLSGWTGAEVRGVDLSRPLNQATVARIRAALLRHKVIFFRGQSLGHAEHIAFARQFGEVTFSHPLEDEPMAAYPEIFTVDRKRGAVQGGKWRAALEPQWHSDVTPALNPPAASILRAHSVPAYGGDTQWTNLVAAYEGLSSPVRELAEKLRAVHRFGIHHLDPRHPYLERVRANPMATEHPVVRVHPETGERALYVAPGFTSHVVGVSQQESRRILQLLFEHVAKPMYSVRFRWQPGDVAFWDNRATAHLAPQDLDHLDVERVLYRVTLTGDVPVGVDGRPSTSLEGEPFGTQAQVRRAATE